MAARIPKIEIFEDPIHDLSFLDWVQAQTNRIVNFTNIMAQLEDKQRVISVALINEALANYVKFYSIQTAFLQIYKNKLDCVEEDSAVMYDRMYMEIKRRVTDPDDELSSKYSKKAATQEEIRKECTLHSDWEKYSTLLREKKELELKISAQRRYLKVIEKWDFILQVLKKRDEKEIKYLYLE